MPLDPKSESLPLTLDYVGRWMVDGTRIPLDNIVIGHNRGETPEQIAYSFGSLKLADIYLLIGYYLRHRDEVDAYVAEQEAEAEAIKRKVIESGMGSPIDLAELRRCIEKRRAEALAGV